MKILIKACVLLICVVASLKMVAQTNYDYSRLKQEKLSRGMVVLRKDSLTNFISWRYLPSDSLQAAFNIYRNGKKINKKPITNVTCFTDQIKRHDKVHYELRLIQQGKEKIEAQYELKENSPIGYLPIKLNVPLSSKTPIGQEYTYQANDASVGDVDGDGEFEIILKWEPSNAHDNSHHGYTGEVIIDCYKISGEQLWRINLGKNIRAGAHYTQFMVFDLDMDGKAEVAMKTADGTVDGVGNVIGNQQIDNRNEGGYILQGDEYLTIFNGETGAEMATVNYCPQRGNVAEWGDKYGNRVDRFLAAVAYLDGEYPSLIMCRGYYTRSVIAAFDWRNNEFTQRWIFDTNMPSNSDYFGQGNHNLRVGDVDADGRDEIIYGQCAIDDDGSGLYSTKMGHGDALHLTAFNPESNQLQVWACHENKRDGSTFRNAANGEIIFQLPSTSDVGRCMAADIDPLNYGVEMWSTASGGIRSMNGDVIVEKVRIPVNMACWWDGDLLREMLDKTSISKYDFTNKSMQTIMEAHGCKANNSSKANPCLQGDLIGDWREEILFRTSDNEQLNLYISTDQTNYKFHTFLSDPVYRISLATQNVGYNQPTQTGFYFGSDLGKCFLQKELHVKGTSVTLDAGMNYDSYDWSVGGNQRTITVKKTDSINNKPIKVQLKVTYRGCEFTDCVTVQFH
ncbi:MAG: rhamnogalacturonan lyase [Mangrovibacterium sp.]